MAARKNKTTLNETWRTRISAGVMLDRLMKHFNGEIEMTPTQLKAGEMVLKKIAPDLQAITMDGTVSHSHTHTIAPTDHEALARYYAEQKGLIE